MKKLKTVWEQHLKNDNTLPDQSRIRDIAWEVGHHYPIDYTSDFCALLMVNPQLGQVYWHVSKAAVDAHSRKYDRHFDGSHTIIRIYDVTDILFDGSNAHMFFDVHVNALHGNYYLKVDKPGRNYLAEAGCLLKDGTFHCFARSNTCLFEKDRPSGNFNVDGLFVMSDFKKIIPIENVFDAKVFERMNRETSACLRHKELRVASVCLQISRDADPLLSNIKTIARHIRKFNTDMTLFQPAVMDIAKCKREVFEKVIYDVSTAVLREIQSQHEKDRFHLIHCHEWYSAAACIVAAETVNIPMLLTLHSTEHERSQGLQHPYSAFICAWEKKAAEAARLVIAPNLSTQQQVIKIYGISEGKVVIISDATAIPVPDSCMQQSDARSAWGLRPDAPAVLFSGEISHASGADILMEALLYVCSRHNSVQFVFAGEGPLKGELESRAWHSGFGSRCRFVGDVSPKTFERLLIACDFVVLPARTWQDEGLAQMAISFGRPVLTTHQAGIKCIVHGDNGLVTYDNPGSIIWGIQELLNNPLQRTMVKAAAKSYAGSPSLDTIAAEHYIQYELALSSRRENDNA